MRAAQRVQNHTHHTTRSSTGSPNFVRQHFLRPPLLFAAVIRQTPKLRCRNGTRHPTARAGVRTSHNLVSSVTRRANIQVLRSPGPIPVSLSLPGAISSLAEPIGEPPRIRRSHPSRLHRPGRRASKETQALVRKWAVPSRPLRWTGIVDESHPNSFPGMFPGPHLSPEVLRVCRGADLVSTVGRRIFACNDIIPAPILKKSHPKIRDHRHRLRPRRRIASLDPFQMGDVFRTASLAAVRKNFAIGCRKDCIRKTKRATRTDPINTAAARYLYPTPGIMNSYDPTIIII